MAVVTEFIQTKMNEAIGAGWRWFSTLTREEWMVVLAVACLMGFLCMRGLGSRRSMG